MPNGFHITAFDERVRENASTPEQRAHARTLQVSLQRRLKAILDAPMRITVDGVQVDVSTFEAMTRKLIDMVLDTTMTVKDRDKIAAYKTVRDTIVGPPKQTVEHQHTKETQVDDLDDIPSEQLEKIAADMEKILTSRPVKALGPDDQ
jgi:hypothetical protein